MLNQFTWSHEKRQKVAFWKLLTVGAIFTVNRYKCFMENKSTKRTFCRCTASKKKNIEPHQSFTVSYKQTVETLDELRYVQNNKRYKRKENVAKSIWSMEG